MDSSPAGAAGVDAAGTGTRWAITASSIRCQPKSSPNRGSRRSSHTSTTVRSATAAGRRTSMTPVSGSMWLERQRMLAS